MDEYIKRAKLAFVIDDTTWYHIGHHNDLVKGAANEDEALYKATDIYEVIRNQPACDVVEVVRCKDCKFWDISKKRFW